MKRQTILILAVLIAAVLLTGTALYAKAGTTRTDFTSTEYVCGLSMDKMWQEGNVLHIRGYEHRNPNISTTPEMNGLNTTFANADINLLTGVTIIRGTFSIKPDGIDGTWEGTWVFNGVPGGSGAVRGVGRGTGDLAGKLIYLKVYDLPPDSGDPAMCAGIGEYEGVEHVEGYFVEP